MFEGGSLRASMREESSASMREGPASMHSTRFVQAHERRVSSNCTIVFGTLQPKTEMRGKYMIFFNFFSTCVSCQDWSHGTAHHALPIYLMFGSFLNVHMVYQFICLAATPRLCAQSGCCCQTYKMIYHDVRECKKGFAERGAQEVSRPEP